MKHQQRFQGGTYRRASPPFWLLLLGLPIVSVHSSREFRISYVLEPFDHIQHVNFSSSNQQPVLQPNASDWLFGTGAAILPLMPSSVGRLSQVSPWNGQRHNCVGATHFSLWYKTKADNCQISLSVLVPETPCDGPDCDMEEFELEGADESSLLVADEEWHELTWLLDGADVDVGVTKHLDQLLGWFLSVRRGEGSESNEASTILLDHLACFGGGDLFGAAFKTRSSLESAFEQGAWFSSAHQSPLSFNATKTELVDEHIVLDPYLVEQTEHWGGFYALEHIAPFSSYYNLSGSKTLSMLYNVTVPLEPERVHFRIILRESEGCTEYSCRHSKSHEWFYSFHHLVLPKTGTGVVTAALRGDDSYDLPFVFTGWEGTTQNRRLDIEYIKGIRFELSTDQEGEIGSTATGSLSFGPASVSAEDGRTDSGLDCQEGELISLKKIPAHFQSIPHERNCCERCQSDSQCLFAFSRGKHCYLAPYIGQGVLGLKSDILGEMRIFSLVAQDNFCEVCTCNKDIGLIDCRGRDLKTIPSTFRGSNEDKGWVPRILDLRNNPRLSYIGPNMLSSLADDLEELLLPQNMEFISQQAVLNLTKLSIVRSNDAVEGTQGKRPQDGLSLQNAIVGENDLFGDVCCGRGASMALAPPSNQLFFCDFPANGVGLDAEYLPFVNFEDAGTITLFRPNSPFMSEASHSPTFCAEYCSMMSECRYFVFDRRITEAENSCRLLRNNGTRAFNVCCKEEHYADTNQTIPGYVSGWSARTRHEKGARVHFSTNDLTANPQNGYESQYEVSLGAMPSRGAVWVTPTVASSTLFKVDIWPKTFALYDNITSCIVTVSVPNANKPNMVGETIVIVNIVKSCDTAFTSSLNDIDVSSFLHVVRPNSTILLVSILAPTLSLLVLSLVGLHCFLERKKARKAEAFWEVKRDELKFPETPHILGKGTFGLVLLATYRGTDVAVKRVIPRDANDTRSVSGSFDDFCSEADGKRSSDSDGQLSKPSECMQGSTMQFEHGGSVMRSVLTKGVRGAELKMDFRAEMQHLAKLRHPCITTVLGAVVEKRSDLMLVMELMHNGSLHDILQNETMVLEGDIILPILRDISQGMRFLHAASPVVLHGDLKSHNVLVDSKFRGKVSDFGLTQKQTLGVSGTPYWLAPEILRNESQNTKMTDVFSFGIVLFEVYARQDPYDGEEFDEVIRQVSDSAIAKRPSVPIGCPPKIQALMKDCLMDSPSYRPTFEEIDLQLKRFEAFMVDPKDRRSNDCKTEKLLLEVFPKHVADALRAGRQVEPETRDMVSIFFSDIVGFTEHSSTLSPMKVSNLLGRLYSKFDALSEEHDVFKVETIGDAYMSVTNLNKIQPDHTKRIVDFAVDVISAANSTMIDEDNPSLGFVSIRVGIHAGPCVCGVVGTIRPRFCLFGNTVNVASRMESSSAKNRIHCSEESAALLRQQCPSLNLERRGLVNIKGKGDMVTYWVQTNKAYVAI